MQIKIESHELVFFDCMEICQGGPEACSVSINGELIEGHKFDPSPLAFEDKILVPMRKIGFFKSGYVLVRINPISLVIEPISKIYNYMRLSRIDGRSIEFATTAWGSETAHFAIP